ncbi:MAG: FGGY family carbohydrate kinase, partial [Desulfobacteraceae bacterium]|nr:FGGY family carbohydrate kinase [Desulfobacteraceae bacterium]
MQDAPPEKKHSQQAPRYVLAIDLGSGGHKAAIVSDTGQIIASASGKITTQMLPDGGAEQDPLQWWQGARKVAKQVVRESGVAPQDIV